MLTIGDYSRLAAHHGARVIALLAKNDPALAGAIRHHAERAASSALAIQKRREARNNSR